MTPKEQLLQYIVKEYSSAVSDQKHQIVEDLRCSKTYGETREWDWDLDVSITAKDGNIEFEEKYEDLSSNQQESIIQSLLQDKECGRTGALLAVGNGTLFHVPLDTSLYRTKPIMCYSCQNLSRHKVPLYVRPLRNAPRSPDSAEPAVTLRNMQVR